MSEQFNRKSERERRRELRASMPDAEVMLWSRLKGRQLLGCRFRRQYSVGSYVIDFFSAEIKLGIEVDGEVHHAAGVPEYDQNRQLFIESFGIRVIRFWNRQVYDSLDDVVETIGREVASRRAGLK